MNEFFPPFDAYTIFVEPWSWGAWKIRLLAMFVFISCGLAGNYLILRRMALVGDALSHSVLPGIVIAFIIAQGSHFWVVVGAILAGLATSALIEWLNKNSRVKQDVAIGVTFTTLFALGVVLINVFAGRVHLDADCVLYGDVEQAPVAKLIQSAVIAMITIVLVVAFFKELLVTSFDPTLASSMGIPSKWVHYGLMGWLSVVVVSAFEAVGSIMVVGMLILPGATGLLLSERLSRVMIASIIHAVLSSFLGYHVGLWLDCKIASAMVSTGFFLFVLAWFFSPTQGLISQWIARSQLRSHVREAALAES